MLPDPYNPQSGILAQFFTAACLLFLCGGLSVLKAQCPVNDQATWPTNAMITYHLDSDVPADDQIRRAMSSWDSANQVNASGVRFEERFNPMQIPAALNFLVGVNPIINPDGSTSYAAGLTHKEIGTGGCSSSATITLDLTPRAGVNLSPGTNGADNIVEKITLHEVGHTMDLVMFLMVKRLRIAA